MEYRDYFEFRQVRPDDYAGFQLPHYVCRVIAEVSNPRVLDFGCGFGQMLHALGMAGVTDADGLDIEPAAIQFCRTHGFRCTDGLAEPEFYRDHAGHYDFILLSHVLEHFPKDDIIDWLKRIKALLKPGGGLIVMVPNAQSNTGAYWAYEDFTHNLLFTSGSLYYVLKAAGFATVEFLDIDCTDGLPAWKRALRKLLLRIYRTKLEFWNRVTGSAVHRPSPLIFSYEIKALARV